ncbi:MAG: hypothetical protein KF754_01665 [Planctomycetes bacterium]|nr:hypothetical protein [Planctomycetota bacterium]
MGKKDNSPQSGLTKADGIEMTVKALISSIPYVGSALSVAIFDMMDKKRQKRVEAFMAETAETLKAFADKIDKSYFESDEFEGIFRKTLHKVQVEPDPIKQELAHNLLTRNTIEGKPDAYDFDAYIVELIGTLTTLHFECLFATARRPDGNVARQATAMRHLTEAGFHWTADIADAVKRKSEEIEPVMQHLKSLGLCDGIDGMRMFGGSQSSTTLAYGLSEAGRQVLLRVQPIAEKTVEPPAEVARDESE